MVAGDVSDFNHSQQLVKEAAQAMGGIDMLLLNHVIGYWGVWLDETAEQKAAISERLMRINALRCL